MGSRVSGKFDFSSPEPRIIEPLASRRAKFRFKTLSEEVMSNRILHICNQEGLNLGGERLVDGADEYLQLLDVASNTIRAPSEMAQDF
ncbi:unnamed protein product [Eruca vesicaria subsp. sativa]|uniref:Uncharacterized protein n=1 Tax=Eruca vesicaria subsp. sativa TaxID=29727 RepID=A0ABC8KN30_ERUVS|nr:unnamed protein product [Eruca vesicaria subsp. sativa]